MMHLMPSQNIIINTLNTTMIMLIYNHSTGFLSLQYIYWKLKIIITRLMSCTNSPAEQTFYFRTSKKHPQCVSGKLEQSIYKHVTVCLSLQTEKKITWLEWHVYINLTKIFNRVGLSCESYFSNKNPLHSFPQHTGYIKETIH